MAFKNESQLRKLWKDGMDARSYFVEPAIGSTFGLPDVFSLHHGVMKGSELKKGTMVGNRLRFKVRSSQRQIIPDLIEDGALIAVSVAVVGTGLVYVIDADLLPGWGVLSGDVDLDLIASAVRLQWSRAVDPELVDPAPRALNWGECGGRSVTWVVAGEKSLDILKSLKFKGFFFSDVNIGSRNLKTW